MLSGAITALVTPMRGVGEIDWDAFDRLVGWQLEQGIDGLVVAGTTGESVTLSRNEWEQLLERTVELVAGQVPVIAGTGSSATEATVRATERAAELGADAALVVTPCYNRPPQAGLAAHYRAVAATGLPVVLYNVPGRTGVDLLPATVRELADEPGIIAIKEAVADAERIRALIELVGEDLVVLSGDDASAARSLGLGARGVISVVSNLLPGPMARLCADPDAESRLQADAELQPVYAASMIEPNPIPIKWSLYRMGIIENVLRLPLVPLSAAGAEKIAPVLEQYLRQESGA